MIADLAPPRRGYVGLYVTATALAYPEGTFQVNCLPVLTCISTGGTETTGTGP